MYDHERSLVTKMEKLGQPFALVGVNCYDSLKHIRKTVKEENLNWRSFFAGQDPEVRDLYNIQTFPTIIYIDEKGIVRKVSQYAQDNVIDELLAEIE